MTKPFSLPLATSATAMLLMAATANAAVVSTTVGNTTTYSENFNNASTNYTLSAPALMVNAPFTTDDFLLISGQTGSASYSITAASYLKSLTIGFWYAASATGDAEFKLNGSTYATAASGMPFVNYVAINPGPGGLTDDVYYTKTWTDLAPGQYTFSFATSGQLLDTYKLDDVTITATVPEPGSLALAGLCLAALAVSRRRAR